MKIRHLIEILLLVALPAAASAQQADDRQPRAQMAQGDYGSSIALWDQWLAAHPDDAASLLQRGEAYLALGYIREAIGDLRTAVKLAEPVGDQALLASARIALGNAYYRNQRWQEALEQADQGRELALASGRQDLLAIAVNLLGNLAQAKGNRLAAGNYYFVGEKVADASGDAALAAQLKLNLARNETDDGTAIGLLRQVYAASEGISTSLERATILVAIGYQAQRRNDRELAYRALTAAIPIARSLQQDRMLSQALGYLGRLYEEQGRYAEGLELTGKAIAAANKVPVPDLLLEWEWQQGRLQKAMNEPVAALASYRRAVAHLQSIRGDIPVQYRDGRSSFRETLEPVYLGLVELLLDRSRAESNAEVSQQLLFEAQNTVELLKTAELQDYFADACAVVQTPLIDLEGIAGGSAVLYPIILPDRLELLTRIRGILYLDRVPVPAYRLEALIFRLVNGLRLTATGDIRPFDRDLAREIYRLLIAPAESRLSAAHVDTLVFVPDGVLRNLPLGALWDGERYLAERYAIAVVPGLTLLDPKPIPKTGLTALLSGLSEPGDVVDEVADVMGLGTLPQPSIPEPAEGTRRIAVRSLRAVAGDPTQRAVRARWQRTLALPGVVRELDRLADILPSERLLNEQFRLQDLEREMQQGYRIVHIASHVFFSGDPEKSFIMTYDQILNMNRLGKLFQSERYSETPVEILTLSACQTAEGDDRSPLGLSGVALKSGARSALGSLWPVSDEAAQILLPEFYRQLQQPGMTKARALQRAQVELLHREGFEHPTFWSSFILIGNWL